MNTRPLRLPTEAVERSLPDRFLRAVCRWLLWLLALTGGAWAFGALWFDFPASPAVGHWVAWGFLAVIAMILSLARGSGRKAIAILIPVLGVAMWWMTLRPSNDREWQPDVARTAWAEVNGDEITLHNVRNFIYRTDSDYTPRWETRKVRLSQITGIDLAACYWGSPWMAHPIVSFQFADAPPVCFSIETRKQVGEKYSAIGGLYRQFELIYVVADERDVIRLRVHFRKGEEVYLYRVNLDPDAARRRFLEYVGTLNALHDHPRWYHALSANCTTMIRAQHDPTRRLPWDWRLLVNGKADELLYERGSILDGGLYFPELKAKARIADDERLGAEGTDFLWLIREGRPGFMK